MTPRSLLHQLVQDVRDDLPRFDQVETLLTQQRQALIRHDPDRLSVLNNELQPLLEKIGETAQLRSNLLSKLGVRADHQGMSQLLARLSPALAQQLKPLWLRLQEALARCRKLNEHNGRILAGQRELLDQLLETDRDYGRGY